MKRAISKALANNVYILILCILLNTGILARAEDDTSILLETEIKKQERSLEAYKLLCDKLFLQEAGAYKYPEEFSGVWYQDGLLNIALTDVSEKTTNRYYSILQDYADSVTFTRKEFSYNELALELKKILEESKVNEIAIYKATVDEKNNQIIFETDPSDKERLLILIKKSNYPVAYSGPSWTPVPANSGQ